MAVGLVNQWKKNTQRGVSQVQVYQIISKHSKNFDWVHYNVNQSSQLATHPPRKYEKVTVDQIFNIIYVMSILLNLIQSLKLDIYNLLRLFKTNFCHILPQLTTQLISIRLQLISWHYHSPARPTVHQTAAKLETQGLDKQSVENYWQLRWGQAQS